MEISHVSYVKLAEKFENGFKIAEKKGHWTAKHKKRRKYYFFSHFFFLLGTIEKNDPICRTIGDHIQT